MNEVDFLKTTFGKSNPFKVPEMRSCEDGIRRVMVVFSAFGVKNNRLLYREKGMSRTRAPQRKRSREYAPRQTA